MTDNDGRHHPTATAANPESAPKIAATPAATIEEVDGLIARLETARVLAVECFPSLVAKIDGELRIARAGRVLIASALETHRE